MAYPVLSAKCKDVPEACIKDGTLDFVSVYGEIGYEDLDFFMMLDETLPSDAPFPRVYLKSYGAVDFHPELSRFFHREVSHL